MKFYRAFLAPATIMLGMVTAHAAHCQVPVTDGGSIFQEIKSNLQAAQAFVKQNEQYLTELQTTAQLATQTAGFIQNPSLGAALGLMSASGYSDDLPVNPYSLMSLTSGYGMSFSGLSGKLSTLGNLANSNYGRDHIYDCSDGSFACQQQKRRGYGLAGVAGFAQSAYQDLQNHQPTIQALRDRAATANTPAERENLMVALQTEQLWHQNVAGKIEAARIQSEADQGSLVQQGNEQMSRDIEATIAGIPGG